MANPPGHTRTQAAPSPHDGQTGRGRRWGTIAWGVRVGAVLLALGPCTACDVPMPEDAMPMSYALPEVGLLVLNRHRGGLAALDLATGRPRWTSNPPRQLAPLHGHFGASGLACRPEASPRGWILLSYTQELRVLSAEDGSGIWRREVAAQPACPTVAPDDAVLVATYAPPHGAIERFDHTGKLLWTCPLPDVGPVTGSLQVVSGSGDTLGRSHTHAFSISPAGKVNWVRSIADLGAGRL